MRQVWFPLLSMLLAVMAASLKGDTVRLRDGKAFDGTFVGGSARTIDFLTASGKSLKLPIEGVQSVSFSVPPAPAPASSEAAPARRAVTIPAGTQLRVRTIDLIDVDATKAGSTYKASLDDPLMVDGDVVVPRGADVVLTVAKVDQGGRFKGSDLIELKLNSIVARGRSYPVVTSLAQTKSGGEGKKTARKVVGGSGLGAIVGGIAGGGTGAAIGALAGGAAGTAMAAAGQPHLKVPPESRLEFQLLSDLKIN
jgi:hypothetical protein